MTNEISLNEASSPSRAGRKRLAATPASVLHGLLTDTQVRVLHLLLLGDGDGYYQREIAERTGLRLRLVQDVLARLGAAGIVRREQRGRQVFYRANPQCPILPELRGMLVKTVGLADRLREALTALDDQVEVAFVFGSWARGEQRARSDVDLMVLGAASTGEVVNAIHEAGGELGREINAVVYTPGSVRAQVRRREHFLTSVLDEPKVFLKGDEDALRALVGRGVA